MGRNMKVLLAVLGILFCFTVSGFAQDNSSNPVVTTTNSPTVKVSQKAKPKVKGHKKHKANKDAKDTTVQTKS
ncbi:MAG: hypothetical protein NTY47_05865 [Candidatus Omnitrophica bacterium]|nr:hypothetical protein [Candidatus Omnitrophota bacterium]